MTLKKIFLLIWLCWVLAAACGIQFFDQGSNPGPLHWELRVLATGPPGKSPEGRGFISNYPIGSQKERSFLSGSLLRNLEMENQNSCSQGDSPTENRRVWRMRHKKFQYSESSLSLKFSRSNQRGDETTVDPDRQGISHLETQGTASHRDTKAI